jgi:type I restriction enzyme M protein
LLATSVGSGAQAEKRRGSEARDEPPYKANETTNPDKFSRLFGSMTWTAEEVLSRDVLAAVVQTMGRIPKMHEDNMSHDVLGDACVSFEPVL